MDNNVIPSVRVFQRGKSIHKIVHNISLGQVLTSGASSCRGRVTSSLMLLLLLFLPQCRTGLHRDERCAARLEPRCDPTQRLALPAVLLVLPCAEIGFMACRVGCDRCTSIGLDVEYMGFDGVGVDELGGWRRTHSNKRIPYVCAVGLLLCEACE